MHVLILRPAEQTMDSLNSFAIFSLACSGVPVSHESYLCFSYKITFDGVFDACMHDDVWIYAIYKTKPRNDHFMTAHGIYMITW